MRKKFRIIVLMIMCSFGFSYSMNEEGPVSLLMPHSPSVLLQGLHDEQDVAAQNSESEEPPIDISGDIASEVQGVEQALEKKKQDEVEKIAQQERDRTKKREEEEIGLDDIFRVRIIRNEDTLVDVHGISQLLQKNKGLLNLSVNEEGYTAMHYAALHNYKNTILMLVEHDAHLGILTNAQYTPLMLAAARGHSEMVKTLLTLRLPGEAWVKALLAPGMSNKLRCSADAFDATVRKFSNEDIQKTVDARRLAFLNGHIHVMDVFAEAGYPTQSVLTREDVEEAARMFGELRKLRFSMIRQESDLTKKLPYPKSLSERKAEEGAYSPV